MDYSNMKPLEVRKLIREGENNLSNFRNVFRLCSGKFSYCSKEYSL